MFLHNSFIAANSSLLLNGSFEDTEKNWSINNANILFHIDSTIVHEGTQSAQITNNASTTYGIEQVVKPIKPDNSYKITAAVRAGTPSPTKILLRIAWYSSEDGTGSQIKTDDSYLTDITQDWQPLVLISTSPRNTNSAKLRLLVSNGTAYFDNVTMTEYVPPSPTPTTQPTLTFLPTPTAVHTPFAIPTFTNIIISEVMVFPSAGDLEWIEIYNGNNAEVTLKDWYFDDAEDEGSSPKKFSLQLKPYSYTSYEFTSSMFNNNGDQVRLLDSMNRLVDSFTYTTSDRNLSWGRENMSTHVFCLQQPSKNTANSTCVSATSQTDQSPPAKAAISGLNTISRSTNQPINTGSYRRYAVQPVIYLDQEKPEVLEEYINIPSSQKDTIITSLTFMISSFSLLSISSLLMKIYKSYATL